MDWLAVTDVEQIVHLVSEAADPTTARPIPERKRMLVEGIVRLIAADTWVWSTAVADPRGNAMTTCILHGGWMSEDESGRVFAILTDTKFNWIWARYRDTAMEQHVTLDRTILTREPALPQFDTAWHGAGFGDYLISMYPLGKDAFSAIGLHRRLGKPAFTGRDRAVVHVFFQQVDWLHRHGTDVPAKDRVLNLSPRERQVMIFLLGGDSQEEVARKLQLSEHTVGDYVKRIYKHFDVNSRAELLSHFIAGGQR